MGRQSSKGGIFNAAIFAIGIITMGAAGTISIGTGPTWAQDEDGTPETASAPVDTIIVKGLKRDEAFIEAPVTVQVFNEAAIENAGIERPQDYLQLTPNVTFLASNHAGEFFVNIRGQASVRQSESAVAVVIDGVQLATQNEFNGELFDLQQIEVLKGPQGALYGRNAAAGAIIITTKAPTDDFEGQGKFSYGNWDSVKATASVGGAIVPGKLRFRAAGAYTDTDGPFTNIVTGEKPFRLSEELGRLRLDWLASDDVTVDFRIGGSRVTGGAIAFNPQIAGTTVGGVFVEGIDTNNTDVPFVADVPGRNLQSKFDTSLKVDWELGFATLTSVTAWSQITDNYQAKNLPYADFLDPRNDFGVFAVVFGDRTQKFRIANRAFNQELRLTSSNDSRIQWQVGFYFLDADRKFTTEQGLNGRPLLNPDGTIVPPLSLAPDGSLIRTLQGGGVILPTRGIDGINTVNPTDNYDENLFGATNYAPFGNVQFNVTDALEVSLALRYDIERRSIRTLTPDIPNPVTGASTYNLCVLTTGRSANECFEKETFKQLQPKATLTYVFGDTGSVFFSYGRSFKSGGYNPIGTRASLLASPGADPNNIFVQDAYNKETADAFEIGFKSLLFDGRVAFNGAVFYTDVSQAQQFEFFPNAGIQAVSSIDKVRIWGLEADANIEILDSLDFFFGGGYIDAEIKRLDAAPQFEGNRAPYTANYNLFAGLQLVQPIANGLTLLGRVQYTRTGSIWFDSSNLPGSKRDPVDLVDLRLGVGSDRWEITFWAKNLFNEKYNNEAIPLLAVLQAVYKAPTRSYGVEAKVRF